MNPSPPQSLKVLYSADMVSSSGRSGSPSDGKPRHVAEALKAKKWPIEFIAPAPASRQSLIRAHNAEFVEDVLDLKRKNGFGTTSESVARSLPYTCGACYDSALIALEEGISSSLTSGFHHAGPDGPNGFCTFNGLMTAALQLLTENSVRKLAIIDCDYHHGNGTQAIIDAQNLSETILHISFGNVFRSPSQALLYLKKMEGLYGVLENFAPDMILYQAGADAHVDDPLGGVLSTEQMRRRDHLMFHAARKLQIPLTWNLAGGYQVEADGSIPRVIQLHTNTFEEALRVWHLQ